MKFLIFSFCFLFQFSVLASKDSTYHYFEKASILLNENKVNQAKKIFNQLLSKKYSIDKKAYIQFLIGQTYRSHFLFVDAENILRKALKKKDLINKLTLGDIYNDLGLVYFDQHQYPKALPYLTKSLTIYSQKNDDTGLAIIYNNLGIIFKETGDFKTAIQFYNLSIKHAKNAHLKDIMSSAYTNLGTIYYHQNFYNESISYYEKALQLIYKDSNYLGLGNLYFNIGLSHLDLRQLESAKKNISTSLNLYRKINYKEGIFMCYVNLYYTYFLLKDFEKMNYFKQLSFSKEFDNCYLNVHFDFYTYLKKEAKSTNNTINELKYSNKLLILSQKMLDNYKNDELNRLKSDANYSRVSNELFETKDILKSETKEKNKIKRLNQQLKRQNKLIIFLSFSGFILIILVLIITIKSNQNKKKTNEQLAEQTRLLEEKNKEILNSMEFATSMEKLLLQQMNPHFLYNALTTIEASISIGDIEYAKNYLSLFSDLLRKTLDNSRKDTITLEEEIEFLKAYIALNAVKQGENFTCKFEFEQADIEDFVNTPPMLVQPFIENALIHGLYHKTDGQKELTIRIEPQSNYINWTITDNGVGRKKAEEIGRNHKGISHGIKITVDRIHWMKKRFGNNFSIHYEDLAQGTRVTLKTPIIDETF